MPNLEFFPPRPAFNPMIYAYADTNPMYKGLLKVGYTAIDVQQRVAQQYPTVRPGAKPYTIVFAENAMHADGSCFTDHEMHTELKRRGFANPDGEWFRCTASDVRAAYIAVMSGHLNAESRTRTFGMRPEQRQAVEKTMAYFASSRREDPNRSPKFLWNAKMRFGKTFASYQLAKKMDMKRVLVLTFKPAVEAAWEEDLMTHVDFEGWQFICRTSTLTYETADLSRPIVCFGSFQDYLGTNENGGIKAKNEWVHTTNWDMVIFDEYHFGAWRENARKLFEQEDDDAYDTLDLERYKRDEADNAYNETFLPITAGSYLFLSGTPFRAINSGEFIEDQIYNWTYSDEQRAKEAWGDAPGNPYAALPRMVMLTYRMPDEIQRIAKEGEFDEFDLNVFFSAKGKGEQATFVYQDYVQKWLDLIRGAYMPTTTDDLKLGQNKRPAMPYADSRLLSVLSHTFWFLPNVASCFAMRNLLIQRQNNFYHDYKINVCAGTGAGIGVDALQPVLDSMDDPLKSKSITLSCGKLTTGVTVKPWTGIFMLRNLSSPETYFQAAFRVQSPWEVDNGTGGKEIIKLECYVFDFALDRALRQISDYSCRLDINESNPEKKVGEFINFLPVIAYDGSTMRQISAEEILDITMAGTSATLLAKRWESALLVNVDNETLARLMANEDAMRALMNIEGFRSLNADIETIINKSEKVKKAKKEGEEKLTPKEKKELSDEEKDFKSKRKQIQEKLIKFATRVPVFMYLTDYRERSLHDVITQLEPGLFKKVTGLDVKDFELLVSLGVFNGPLMNDAIYKFKRYEDASLSYTGVNRHEGEDVGLWDTVIKREEFDALFVNQQATMVAAPQRADDMPENPFAFLASSDDDEEDEPAPVKKPSVAKKPEAPRVPITPSTPAKPPLAAGSITKHSGIPPRPSGYPYGQSRPGTPVVQPAAPKVDTSFVQVGVKLVHKTFGEGTVRSVKDGRLIVVFRGGEKMFQFPQAIENGFLKKAE